MMDDDFGSVDNIGYSSWLILDPCLLVVLVDQVCVVWKQSEAAPEKETVDPPSNRIPILF